MARVPTRAPLLSPRRSRTRARRRASRAMPRQSVRIFSPFGQSETISRVPCSRLAWSWIRITLSGQSCIPPSINASPARRRQLIGSGDERKPGLAGVRDDREADGGDPFDPLDPRGELGVEREVAAEHQFRLAALEAGLEAQLAIAAPVVAEDCGEAGERGRRLYLDLQLQPGVAR